MPGSANAHARINLAGRTSPRRIWSSGTMSVVSCVRNAPCDALAPLAKPSVCTSPPSTHRPPSMSPDLSTSSRGTAGGGSAVTAAASSVAGADVSSGFGDAAARSASALLAPALPSIAADAMK
eukprot:2425916-Pleurochrysis_carterae.AAC.1